MNRALSSLHTKPYRHLLIKLKKKMTVTLIPLFRVTSTMGVYFLENNFFPTKVRFAFLVVFPTELGKINRYLNKKYQKG